MKSDGLIYGKTIQAQTHMDVHTHTYTINCTQFPDLFWTAMQIWLRVVSAILKSRGWTLEHAGHECRIYDRFYMPKNVSKQIAVKN